MPPLRIMKALHGVPRQFEDAAPAIDHPPLDVAAEAT